MLPGRNDHLVRFGLQPRRVLGCANVIESLMANQVCRNVKRRCGVQMFVRWTDTGVIRLTYVNQIIPTDTVTLKAKRPEGLKVGHRTSTGLTFALYHPTH
jgi:hypothetical protein